MSPPRNPVSRLTFSIDPDLRGLLPPLSPDEREALKRRIRGDGRVLSPLIVWREADVLVDGHHRLDILRELVAEGTKLPAPAVVYRSFPSRYSVIRWMISHQNARRNWTAAERAAAILSNRELVDRLREEARERQRLGRKLDLNARGSKGHTRRFLARLAGVGEGTISRVQRVLDSGNRRVIDLLLVKKRISAREARRLVIRDELRKALDERRSVKLDGVAGQGPSGRPTVQLICEDVLSGLQRVEPGGVSLAFTSPPYPVIGVKYDRFTFDGDYPGYIRWLSQVWKSVARRLRRGGRLVINIDSMADERAPDGVDAVYPLYADTVAAVKRAGLLFMGDICWHKPRSRGLRIKWGTYASCRSPRLRRSYEYLLVFCRESRFLDGDPAKSDITLQEFRDWSVGHWDIAPVRRRRIDHPAPFPAELATRVIKLYSYVDDLVLDPFCGTGTVPSVAASLGRRCIGIDHSPAYIRDAKQRILLETGASADVS